MWKTYNTRVGQGESIRVFPISNWTELDIWQYIMKENIPIVPLYFAAKRPVVEARRHADHGRRRPYALGPDDVIENKLVRFRTLGCYPLTGAIESDAADLQEIVREMLTARTSERQGRLIDKDEAGSMEKKKREGYF
jgi:sulfate adenylyltransferase subunit 2